MKEGDRKLLLSNVEKFLDTMALEHAVMEATLRSQTPRRPSSASSADVMELFCGTMPFTRGCARWHMWAVEPSDLWNGWDYHRSWDRSRQLELSAWHRPRLVIAGVECTPWCWFNVAVNHKDRPDELAEMQRMAFAFLHMCRRCH